MFCYMNHPVTSRNHEKGSSLGNIAHCTGIFIVRFSILHLCTEFFDLLLRDILFICMGSIRKKISCNYQIKTYIIPYVFDWVNGRRKYAWNNKRTGDYSKIYDIDCFVYVLRLSLDIRASSESFSVWLCIPLGSQVYNETITTGETRGLWYYNGMLTDHFLSTQKSG